MAKLTRRPQSMHRYSTLADGKIATSASASQAALTRVSTILDTDTHRFSLDLSEDELLQLVEIASNISTGTKERIIAVATAARPDLEPWQRHALKSGKV